MYQTLLIVHLHVTLFLPEASMLNTEQCIIKTHTITPAFHRLIPAGFFFFFFVGLFTALVLSLGLLPDAAGTASCFQQQIAGKKDRNQ